MTITPFLFEAFLKCPTKCWLRFTGEQTAGNAYAEWVETEQESYRTDAAKRLIANEPETDCAVATVAENLKTAKWRVAVDVPMRIEPRSSRSKEAHSKIGSGNRSWKETTGMYPVRHSTSLPQKFGTRTTAMPLPRIQRGKLWRGGLGYLGKVRPVLVVSVPFLENERRFL